MFNFPTEDIAKAFEAFSEAINDDDALWPNRYGMPPKKSFKQYDYIPIMAKNLPYQRRAF